MRRSTRISKKRKGEDDPTPTSPGSNKITAKEIPGKNSKSVENGKTATAAFRKRMRKTREKLEQDSEHDPFFSLPELVIENLAKFTTNPRDKFSLSRVSPSSDKVLHKSKNKWLFYKIFQIPNLLDHLSPTDLRNIRFVCRGWHFAFQDYTNTHNLIQPDYSSPNYKSLLSPVSGGYRRGDEVRDETRISWVPSINASAGHPTLGKLVQLVQDDFQGNPFPTRGLSLIAPRGRADNPTFWNQLNLILDHFGRELRHSRYFYQSTSTPAEMTERMRGTLERMPHLRTLICVYENNRSRKDTGTAPCPTLPPLPNLTHLNVSATSTNDKMERCPLLMQPFAIYFDQLVSFKVGKEAEFLFWYQPGLHPGFPHLRHLSVAVRDDAPLLKIRDMKCPKLKELEIEESLDNVSLTVHLHVAEAFKLTLTALKIRFVWLRCNSPVKTMTSLGLSEPERIHLRHLKILAVEVRDCGHGRMDSLLKLEKPPQYLELIARKCLDKGTPVHKERSGTEEAVEVHRHFLTDMYKSNVWTLWKELEEVRVWRSEMNAVGERSKREKDTRYTRKEYDELTEQKCKVVGGGGKRRRTK